MSLAQNREFLKKSNANLNFATSRANAASVMYINQRTGMYSNNVGGLYANQANGTAANGLYAGAATVSTQCIQSSPTLQVGGVRQFQPAVLRQNSMGWYIEYYAFNPVANGLERKRIRVNRERKRARTYAEFRSIASQMIIRLNYQLAAGWSPFVAVAVTMPVAVQPAMGYAAQPTTTQPTMCAQPAVAEPTAQAPINYAAQTVVQQPVFQVTQPAVAMQNVPASSVSPEATPKVDDGTIEIQDMIQRFLKAKSRELTANTMRSYTSFCNGFGKWIATHHPAMRTNEFTKRLAIEYMDYVFEGKNANKNGKATKHDDGTVSNRTYNNNLKQGRALFSWAMERCYCEENPFEKIKTKREEQKTRTLIPEQWRQRIRAHFEKNNPQYLIICELVHTSLIRPVEISRLQTKMVNIEESCIEMPATITKNHKARRARLSDELREMLAQHIMGAQGEDYLFADKCWRCGKVPMSSHTYGNVWETMRKAIDLPREMQLYSLRDTGINGMLKAGIDTLSVMQAADHHDLAMTTRYANHADPELFRKLNEEAPKF